MSQDPPAGPPGDPQVRRTAFALADDAVSRIVADDPCTATELGIIDPDGRLTDYSPAGIDQRLGTVRSVLAEAARIPRGEDLDADRALAIMEERLNNLVAMAEAGDHLSDINVLASPPQAIRMALELLGQDCDPGIVSGRLHSVRPALKGWREALARGASDGIPAAQRQALAVATQLMTLADEWLPGYAAGRDAGGLDGALAEARASFHDTALWLSDVYAPTARSTDAVGMSAYRRRARAWLGVDLDLPDTFAWGWQEVDRLVDELRETAERILPGASLPNVKDHLDRAPDYRIHGQDALIEHLEALTRSAIEDLDGTWFDLPAEVRRCDVRIAAPGAAAAPYYLPPSEDLSRPGSTWYPTLGKDVFPRWWLTSVWYHEGVPGHHLQFGMAAVERDRLSRFQRVFGSTSGHSEGWALYAERLMDELGCFDDPGLRFGYLSAQVMRAVRVVVDIGMHCGYEAPGGRWGGGPVDADTAHRMLVDLAMLGDDFAASEVNRYLGLPGQAISYKVGERVWMEQRDSARRADAFDLRSWHMAALREGPMGLGPFRERLGSGDH